MVPASVPASAPARLARFLREAPDGPARVLHHVPTALYLDVAGRCVGVVAPGAAQVPCALRLAEGVSLAEPVLSPYLERGTLYLAGHPLPVGRFVDVRVPRIDPSGVLRRAASPSADPAAPPRPARDGLAAYSPLPARIDAELLARVVGHGGGLTPLGDDVLCGWLAVLHATGRLDPATADLVLAAVPRTTLLSGALLNCALHGEVLPEFARYVAALGTPAEADAARTLMAVGHTSGAGLWFGAEHALRTIAEEKAAA